MEGGEGPGWGPWGTRDGGVDPLGNRTQGWRRAGLGFGFTWMGEAPEIAGIRMAGIALDERSAAGTAGQLLPYPVGGSEQFMGPCNSATLVRLQFSSPPISSALGTPQM